MAATQQPYAPPPFEVGPGTWIERDLDGRVLGLRHLQAPFPGRPGEDPEALALRYLAEVGTAHYAITREQIQFVADRRKTSPPPDVPGHWFRWLPTRKPVSGDTDDAAHLIVVLLQQTAAPVAGLEADIPGMGLRVVVRTAREKDDEGGPRHQVLSSNANVVAHDTRLPFVPEGTEAPARFADIFLGEEGRRSLLRSILGFDGDEIEGSTTGRLVRLPPAEPGEPPVVGGEVDFVRRAARGTTPSDVDAVGHRLTVEFGIVNGGLRLRSLRALAANCATGPTGMVFVQDPASATGDPTLRPGSRASALDPHRAEVRLLDLNPAAAGNQALAGTLVALADPNPIGIDPPREPAPGSFHYSSRTDGFAAVNAYHHCNCAFRMARDFGCTAGAYFDAAQFPVSVAHRAPMVLDDPSPAPSTARAPYVDGQVFSVNAQVLQDVGPAPGDPGRVRQIRFALGDLADGKTVPVLDPTATLPGALGAACDPRLVLHEFGHAVVLAGTGSLELPFAHSVGDSLAAILCDPDSQLARPHWNQGTLAVRGDTFPWVTGGASRRHDRLPEDGWSWQGTLHDPRLGGYPPPLDPGGYLAEQIFSSTLFRLYRALGGDAVLPLGNEPDRLRRRRAAHYVAFLILKALGTLGPVGATPEGFATAMMAVDAALTSFTYEGYTRRGGAAWKVGRWSFERQGAYQAAGAGYPRNAPGVPEPVDLFWEDGRAGEYQFRENWQTPAGEMWVQPPGGDPALDAAPVLGKTNRLRIRLRSRGSGGSPSSGIAVSVWEAAGSAAETWNPATWTLLGTTPVAVPGPVPPAGQVVGPIDWKPTTLGLNALMVAVDAPGDPSLLDPSLALACAAGPTPVAELVPFDNNLAYRSWALA